MSAERPRVIGYVVNASLAETTEIVQLRRDIQTAFPNAWQQPQGSLHVTLMDWLAPLVEYDRHKDALFAELFPAYDQVLRECTNGIGPINVMFNNVAVSDTAVFITGNDDGQFNNIRDTFTDKIALIDGTKRPPNIIHSTIARFESPPDPQAVAEFLNPQSFEMKVTIEGLRLVRESTSPMIEFEVRQSYSLG